MEQEEKRDGSFDVIIDLWPKLGKRHVNFSGERALPLFAPLGAFPRLLMPHRLAGTGCQSGVGRFLKVLGGASLSPIRRTVTQNPLNSSGFYA